MNLWYRHRSFRFAAAFMVVIVVGGMAGYLGLPVTAQSLSAGDEIFLTEGFFGMPRAAGCSAISVASLQNGVSHPGTQRLSPGRMAAVSDLSMVLAIRNNGMSVSEDGVERADIYAARREPSSPSGWTDAYIDLPDSVPDPWSATHAGGIAVSPDDASVLLAVNAGGQVDGLSAHNCGAQRYGVIRLAIADLDLAAHRAGEIRAEFVTAAPVAEIIPSKTQPVVLLVAPALRSGVADSQAYLYTVDAETLTEVAPPISLPDLKGLPDSVCGIANFFTTATMSPDEGHIVITGGAPREIVIVDLVGRSAATQVLDGLSPVERVGGTAFNLAPYHHGLLAVHGFSRLLVYDWVDGRARNLLASAPVAEVGFDLNPWKGPMASVAWSTDGTHILAGQEPVDVEFGSWQLSHDRRQLVPGRDVLVCPDGNYAYPNDILTGNGILPPQTPLPSVTSTATDTPTPSATRTSLPAPSVLHLPIALVESCQPTQRNVDVSLAIDASSSMGSPTASGRSKLAAAVSAAKRLLAALELERGDRAGLVLFNETVTLELPLGSRRSEIDAALDAAAPAPGTCIPCGVETALQQLDQGPQGPDRSRALVLLTDGRSNVRPIEEALEHVEAAKRLGVTVFAVGLGDDVEEAALRKMVSRPSFYFGTLDADALPEIFATIAGEIPCPAERYWGRR